MQSLPYLKNMCAAWSVHHRVDEGYPRAYAYAHKAGPTILDTILLCMGGAPIGASDVQNIKSALHAMLSENANLKFQIKLDSVSLSEAAVQLIQQVGQGIVVLSLTEMELPAESLKSLLGRLTAVHTLTLSFCDWGSQGLHTLCESLPLLSNLERLHLAGLKIGDEGIRALADAIAPLLHMEVLNVDYNNIGDEGGLYAANLIGRELWELWMRYNLIQRPDVLQVKAGLDNGYLAGQHRFNPKWPARNMAFILTMKRHLTLSFPNEMLEWICGEVRELELDALYSRKFT